MTSYPISAHEKRKKDLLVLPAEQLIVLVTLALNKYSADLDELETILHRASERAPGLGSWTYRKLQLLEQKLLNSPYAYGNYRSIAVHADWRNTVIFAADALRPEQLKALVQSVSIQRRYPLSGDPGSPYGMRFDDLAQRCIHKILLNQVDNFDRLYRALQQRRPYEHPTQTAGRRRIDSLLATIDWTFWRTRDPYFQWSALAEHQDTFGHWTENTPLELERMLVPLLDRAGAEDYLEDVRMVSLLGLHHYRERPEIFADYDPGITAVCHLALGETEAAARAFNKVPPHDREQDAGPVHVFRAAFHYGRGEWTKDQLLREASTFTQSNYPELINSFLAYVYQETEDSSEAEELLVQQLLGLLHPVGWLIALCSACWMGVKLRSYQVESVIIRLTEGAYRNLPWLEAELIHVLQRLFPANQLLQKARPQVPAAGSLLRLLPVKPTWVYALRELRKTGQKTETETTDQPEYRTIWIIDFDREEAYCKEQKRGKRGWSKGRKLKWNELLHPKNPTALHGADRKAVRAISTISGRPVYQSMYYNEDNLAVSFGHLLHELVDHPRVYLGENKRIPLELLRAEPE
ncbi:MAG: hypothetical protein AAFZ52_18910, partial [Bacteroidota bacterium]